MGLTRWEERDPTRGQGPKVEETNQELKEGNMVGYQHTWRKERSQIFQGRLDLTKDWPPLDLIKDSDDAKSLQKLCGKWIGKAKSGYRMPSQKARQWCMERWRWREMNQLKRCLGRYLEVGREDGIKGDSRISNLLKTLDGGVMDQLDIRGNAGERVGVHYGMYRVGGTCGVAKERSNRQLNTQL